VRRINALYDVVWLSCNQFYGRLKSRFLLLYGKTAFRPSVKLTQFGQKRFKELEDVVFRRDKTKEHVDKPEDNPIGSTVLRMAYANFLIEYVY
jgi:hypothetical protein